MRDRRSVLQELSIYSLPQLRYHRLMTTAISTDHIKSIIHEELADLVAIRRDLHAHPELGYEDVATRASPAPL